MTVRRGLMAKLTEMLDTVTQVIVFPREDRVFKLNFAVTYRCNSHCLMCSIWKRYVENPKMVSHELEIESIGKIFKNFGKLVWLSLTGGEPSLREDLAEIAQLAKQYCGIKMLNITSNGFESALIEKRVREIAEIGVPFTFVNVSLDGPPGIHDQLRGTSGAYDKAIKTLRLLHRIENDYHNLSVGFEYTATPQNAGSLESLCQKLIVENLGWLTKNLTVTMYHSGNLYNNMGSRKHGDTNFKNQILKDINYCISLSDSKRPLTLIRKTYLKYARNYLRDGVSPLGCVALQNSLFLDPYGNIYPCVLSGEKIGSLSDYQLDTHRLLSSQDAQKMKPALETCRRCWTPCEAYPAILTHLSCLVKVR